MDIVHFCIVNSTREFHFLRSNIYQLKYGSYQVNYDDRIKLLFCEYPSLLCLWFDNDRLCSIT